MWWCVRVLNMVVLKHIYFYFYRTCIVFSQTVLAYWVNIDPFNSKGVSANMPTQVQTSTRVCYNKLLQL